MNNHTKRSYETIRAAAEFCRQNAGLINASSRLGALVGKLEETLQSINATEISAIASDAQHNEGIERQTELRLELENRLRGLAACAALLAETNPELRGSFQLPKSKTHVALLHAAQAAALAIAPVKAIMIECELPANFDTEFQALVDEFEETIDRQRSGRAGRVGSNGTVKKLVSQGTALVRQLDGMFRLKFRGQTNLLQTWQNARRRTRNPHRTETTQTALANQ